MLIDAMILTVVLGSGIAQEPGDLEFPDLSQLDFGSVSDGDAPTDDGDAPSDEGAAAPADSLIGGYPATSTVARVTGVVVIKNGCTGAVVGPRHVLTAAHCVLSPNYRYAGTIDLAQVEQVDAATTWSSMKILKTHVPKAWDDECLRTSCNDAMSITPPYAPDVAVIEFAVDLPAAFGSAVIPRVRHNSGAEVFMAGYGCEVSVNTPWISLRRLKMQYTRTQVATTAVADRRFANTYIVTPGQRAQAMAASLCPGDSGGPLFLSSPMENGPTYPTNYVIGVNAYYTFTDASGVSVTNTHARLWGGSVEPWLVSVLPASSFVYIDI